MAINCNSINDLEHPKKENQINYEGETHQNYVKLSLSCSSCDIFALHQKSPLLWKNNPKLTTFADIFGKNYFL